MCSKFVFRVLVVAVLCLTAPPPSHAQPVLRGLGLRGNISFRGSAGFRGGVGWGGGTYWGGGYGGWRGGRNGYGWVPYYSSAHLYYPSSYPYYPDYGSYHPSSVTQSSLYAISNSEGSLHAELPHPTGTTNPPPDAGLIRLRVSDKFAQVFFNGQEVSSVGTTRAYVTPELQAGTHKYAVKVSWRQITREKTIEVARGRVSDVDFTVDPESKAR
jgi:uncharacterized protein (TIGR03000 family)